MPLGVRYDMDKEEKQQLIEQKDGPAVDTAVESRHADTVKKDTRAKYNTFALLSIVFALAGWVILSFDGKLALAVSVISFILGCFGLKASTRTWRNTAITSIVASAVLMVVLSAFLIVIFVGLNSV